MESLGKFDKAMDRKVFDRIEECANRHPFLASILVALFLPLIIFLLVRPDWFYLQNGIDPFFYVGYVQNPGEIIKHLDQGTGVNIRRYFISRWTLYLPERVFVILFSNPVVAFLLARWIGAAVMVVSILGMLHRRCRFTDAISISALVLLMPMTIRSLLTEYGDAVALPLGLAFLSLFFRAKLNVWVMMLLGILIAAMAIAYPYSLVLVFAAAPFLIWSRGSELKFVPSAALIGSALAVVAFGLVYFRWRYGIDNVYRPTFDFIRVVRENPDIDSYRSQSLDWLGRKLWVFLPALLILSMAVTAKVRGVTFQPVEVAMVGTLAFHYGFHTYDQFIRKGLGWELSYLWSFLLPSLMLVFALQLAAFASRTSRWTLPLLAISFLIFASLLQNDVPAIFPHWGWVAVFGGLILVLLATLPPMWTWFSSVSLVILFFAVQFGSPRETVIATSRFQAFSDYESVYRDNSEGVLSFRLSTWFSEYMRSLTTTQRETANFYVEIGAAPFEYEPGDELWLNFHRTLRMTGTYGALVSGRLKSIDQLVIDGINRQFGSETIVILARYTVQQQVVSSLLTQNKMLEVLNSSKVPGVADLTLTVLVDRNEISPG